MKNNMNLTSSKRQLMVLMAIVLTSIMPSLGGLAAADTSAAATSNTSSLKATKTANQQTHLQNIISNGDQEIARRLTTLNTLTGKINAASHLTANNKATLSSEVNSTTSGLTALKAQLDSETTVAAAASDAQNIYSEYRVYALVAPKVGLIKVSDDQQVVQNKLTSLAQKLQTRITAEQQAGKDVSSMQSELADLNSKVTAAHAISSDIEGSVINLQPSDYNSNHSVLSGDNTQLKTARSDDQAAVTDAKNIVASLKSLK